MSALFFPNQNVLRLVLASGLAPAELARAPARGGQDPLGHVWLELPELPCREVLAGMARVGVQALGEAGVSTEPLRCWAELLALKPVADRPNGRILYIGPDRKAAVFAGRLRRSGASEIGVSLADHPTPGSAWVTALPSQSQHKAESIETETAFAGYCEQVPRVWVRVGWVHPLPEQLEIPQDSLLLLGPPRSVILAPPSIPRPDAGDLAVSKARPQAPGSMAPRLAIQVRLRLASRPISAAEAFWVIENETEFWAACAGTDERLLRRLEVAVLTNRNARQILVRGPERGRTSTFLPLAKTGYVPDSRLPELFVPATRELRPFLRPRDLAAAVGLAAGVTVWLEAQADGSVSAHSVPRRAFRPLSELLEYTPPPAVRLKVEARIEPFALERVVVATEAFSVAETEPPLIITPDLEEPAEQALAPEPGWLIRCLGKLFAWKQRKPEGEPPAGAEAENPPEPIANRRMEQTLASPEVIRHGPDWAARRRELETGLFRDLPRLGTEERATKWTGLANVYAKMGNPGDAAVCWLNAVWEAATPPLPWLQQWLAMECQAAKVPDPELALDRWPDERKPGLGRVVAAYATVAGHTQPADEFLAALPKLIAWLDQQFEDLPLRSAWLARLSAARVCAGDALGLARWHDRLLTRLDDRGPGLDLDEPSFLRFHGNVSSDRFQASRKCLEAVREKVHGWLLRHARPGRRLQADRLLQWAGIIAEKEATAAYADYMLAWGLASLGERTQATTWAARARKRLAGVLSPGADPAAHAVLADLFLHRIKDAQDGRSPKPGLPADLRRRLDSLPLLARYAADRLRAHSRILEPLDHAQPYRGRDLRAILGTDRLGERLVLLFDRSDPAQFAAEADSLLRLCTDSPTTDVVPRVVLALLEIAPKLDLAVQLRVLDLLPESLDKLEAWVAAGGGGPADRLDRLSRYRTRMIKAGVAVAAALDPGQVGGAIGQLVRHLTHAGPAIRDPILGIAPQVFRTLRRLGLTGEAETLVRCLAPRDPTGDQTSLAARLGLAVGWFTVGNDDAGYQIIDEARSMLYLSADLGDRDRTHLALAYAEALGFAPTGIAHGRLGELFERLDRVTVSGSTNQYFTLKPLHLIDVVVRAIVTEDFALGPAVRGWLDDDEFLIRGRIHRDLAAVLREQGVV